MLCVEGARGARVGRSGTSGSWFLVAGATGLPSSALRTSAANSSRWWASRAEQEGVRGGKQRGGKPE